MDVSGDRRGIFDAMFCFHVLHGIIGRPYLIYCIVIAGNIVLIAVMVLFRKQNNSVRCTVNTA